MALIASNRLFFGTQAITSELLTYPPGKAAENHLNDEVDEANSFCIVALSSVPSSCPCPRKRPSEATPQPHLAWLFASRGADQTLSAFSISRRVSLASP